ncbi:MAG TPA: exodeoxyribonuclease VII small subunit [Polyangiaceae bacterium]
MSDKQDKQAQAPSFEDAVKRLTEIIERLERGDLPLEESIALFEEGVKLSAASQARLDAAEKKVEELLHVDAAGNARTARFGAPDDDDV